MNAACSPEEPPTDDSNKISHILNPRPPPICDSDGSGEGDLKYFADVINKGPQTILLCKMALIQRAE